MPHVKTLFSSTPKRSGCIFIVSTPMRNDCDKHFIIPEILYLLTYVSQILLRGRIAPVILILLEGAGVQGIINIMLSLLQVPSPESQ
jgi:hypothetical protein